MLKKLAVLLGLLILSQTAQAEIRIGVVNIPLLMANAPQAADLLYFLGDIYFCTGMNHAFG
jgi:Skp family chaperone for outer membrane proteins